MSLCMETISEPLSAPSVFWRDQSLPFLEGRTVLDGRAMCHARHTHDTFSIGAILGGHSSYLNGKVNQRVGAGAIVIVNPETTHACNPMAGLPWAYHMLYVDTAWLTALQHELGFSRNQGWREFAATMTDVHPALFAELHGLCTLLAGGRADPLQKQGAAIAFFSNLQQALHPSATVLRESHAKLERAVEYINDRYPQSIKLADLCQESGLSPSYLIRAFKERYGMTPHAYLINRRVQYCRAQLRRGRAIAAVALEAGFADQAHLQRSFKQLLAATPGQYRGRDPAARLDRR